ncbi:MAG: SET domain-containing protein-lysine N-methyltransferase [Planctomycetota bacterium]|jgi:SET domain-containing protein
MSGQHTPLLEKNRDRLRRLLRVGPTHVGSGVFASRRLKAGMVIGEINGEISDEHPADPSYCMELASGKLLEPAAPLRFVNHSCDPNCELFYWFDEDASTQEDRLWLQTIRTIEPGEELSIDYCWPADAAIPCRCGATNCRNWIVDPEELHLLPPAAGDGSPAASSQS